MGGALIALSALQFGTVVLFGAIVLRSGLSVFSVLAARFGLAALILAAILVLARRPLLAAPGERVKLALLGVFGYAVESSFFFGALPHGTVAAVTLLFFTYPVFVAAGSWALGLGAPGWLLGGSLLAAVTGAAIVVTSSGGVSIEPLGVLFALGSATTFSAYLIGAELVLRRTDGFTGALWTSASASVGLVVLALIFRRAAPPQGVAEWGPIVVMGLATAGAFICLLSGLRRVGAVRAAIVSAMEPLAAATLAAVFLDERIAAGTAVGGALILVGAVTASLARRRLPVEPPMP